MAKPGSVKVAVELPADQGCAVGDGMRKLYERGELCDVVFMTHGEKFPAHKAMLAAMSTHFRNYLQQLARGGGGGGGGEGANLLAELLKPAATPSEEKSAAEAEAAPAGEAAAAPESAAAAAPEAAPQEGAGAEAKEEASKAAEAPKTGLRNMELDVLGLNTAEGVRIMLDYMYSVGTVTEWQYSPSSLEVNRDVLRLAQHFNLQHLHENAARWLAKDLTTENVVSRLVICEDLGLHMLRDKIIEQITQHPAGLTMVSTSPEIMKHPKILQDLLIRVASVHNSAAAAAKEKENKEPTPVKETKQEEKKEEKEEEKEEVKEEVKPAQKQGKKTEKEEPAPKKKARR